MLANPIDRLMSVRAAVLSGAALLIISTGVASAQPCSLALPVSWALGGSGLWANAANWSSGAVPNSPTTNVCITDGQSTVTLDESVSVGSLQLAQGNTLSTLPGVNFAIAGPQFVNESNLQVNASNRSNSILSITKDVELSDPEGYFEVGGFVTLNSTGAGTAYIRGAGHTLTIDPHNTIQGSGVIGDDGLSVNVNGTIDANQSGQRLSLNAGNGGVTNHSGRIQASNGGVLFLYNTITNDPGEFGGNINANSGGTVNIAGTIVGGEIAGGGGTIQTHGATTARLT